MNTVLKRGKVMTYNELEQLLFIKTEIMQLEQELEELEAAAICQSAVISGLPGRTGVSDRVGNYAVKIVMQRDILRRSLQKLYLLRTRAELFVENIDDSYLRTVLRMRFINGLNWQQIAFKTGAFDEATPRKSVVRFFKRLEAANNSGTKKEAVIA